VDRELKKIKGVILDVDGTLVDSNDAHVHSWVKAMQAFGYDVRFEQIRRFVGMGGDNLLPAAIGVHKDSDLGEQIAQRRQEIFKEEYLPTIQAFAGVKPLIERLQANDLKIAVASSGEQDEVQHLLSVSGIEDLVETQTSSADVEKSKPNPDVVQAALEKLALDPAQVLMLGDTPYDVQAAAKVGVGVIVLRCGGFSDRELQGAVAIYDSPEALLKDFEQSPLSA